MAVTAPLTPPYVRLVVWLKWRLLTRTYNRSGSAKAGLVIMILVFVPISAAIAVGTALAYVNTELPTRGSVLLGVLSLIYLFWGLSPVIGYALSDTFDVTRLFTYPITARQILVGLMLGSLMDFTVLLLTPALLAVLVGFHALPALPIIVAALILFLLHTLSLTQGLILVSSGLLRSRRTRDLVIVVVPFLWLLFYLFRLHIFSISLVSFTHSSVFSVLRWLPPGLLARSIVDADAGRYIPAVELLALGAAVAAATIALLATAIDRLFAGDDVGVSFGRRTAPARAATPKRIPVTTHTQSGPMSRIPVQIKAVVDKDLRYLIREPYYRIVLMNLVYMMVIPIAITVSHSNTRTAIVQQRIMPWVGAGLILLSEMQVVANIFGIDAGSANLLFMYPAPRVYILLGKNLASYCALTTINITLLLVLCFMNQALAVFPLVAIWMALALVVMIALGNVSSIWFPFRVGLKGFKIRQQAAGRGLAYAAISLITLVATMAAMTPVMLALLLPTILNANAWIAASVPLSLAYAAGIYAVGLKVSAGMLIKREQELVAALTASEG